MSDTVVDIGGETPQTPKRTRRKKAESAPSIAVVIAEKTEDGNLAVNTVAPVEPEPTPVPRKKKYLNNADLMKQIALSHKEGRITNELGKMLQTLCARYAKHPDYSNIYSYKEDMEAFAMMTVCKVWKSFNHEKFNNPFAYFTQVIRHAFYQYLNHEKRQREVKDNLLVEIGELPSFTFMENYREERDAEYDGSFDDGDDSDDESETRHRRAGYEATLPGAVTEINYDFPREDDLPPMEDGDTILEI